MFHNLKKRIETETGENPVAIPYRNTINRPRHSVSSHNSIDELAKLEEKEAEINALKAELVQARALIATLDDEKQSLEESIKAGRVQKEMFYDETDKIQNVQQQEIIKLKSMLLFREQESIDQLNKSKNDQMTIDQLKSEISRIKTIEPIYENVKDELENLRRTSQLEKNQLVTQLSAKEEDMRHLKTRLEISEQSRALFTSADAENDKINLLLQERKMLENRLEEAHLHLYDIKSSWTSQNLTLENQLHRLSRQVAEETAEKRKAFELKESMMEKIKLLEFDLIKVRDELKQRDNKIKLMNEEIDELNSSLRDIRLENEEEIEFLRSKVAYQESELTQAKETLLSSSDSREELEAQILLLQREKRDQRAAFNVLNEEKSLMQDQLIEIQDQLKGIEVEYERLQDDRNERLEEIDRSHNFTEGLKLQIEKLEADVIDKTKAVKILNQRLFDVKKTLQEEIKNNNSGSSGSMPSNAPAILIPVNVDNNISYQNSNNISRRTYEMDEVKFSYLKHVILKFLTSQKEFEAKHLIRAVSTLLYLSDSEEKLLTDTLEYRRSWSLR